MSLLATSKSPKQSSTGNVLLLPNLARHPKMHKQFLPVERGVSMNTQLYDILTTPTPSGKERNILKFMPKGYEGNLIYRIGNAAEHKTMFSSHMDTVHRSEVPIILLEGKSPNTREASGIIYGATKDGKASVLGADDRVGMFIMFKLMEAKVPGLYVFHVEEEIGRKGSIDLFKTRPAMFENIRRCIAFDRRGTNSIITYQSGKRCCSDEFANALADQLNGHMKLPANNDATDTTGS